MSREITKLRQHSSYIDLIYRSFNIMSSNLGKSKLRRKIILDSKARGTTVTFPMICSMKNIIVDYVELLWYGKVRPVKYILKLIKLINHGVFSSEELSDIATGIPAIVREYFENIDDLVAELISLITAMLSKQYTESSRTKIYIIKCINSEILGLLRRAAMFSRNNSLINGVNNECSGHIQEVAEVRESSTARGTRWFARGNKGKEYPYIFE